MIVLYRLALVQALVRHLGTTSLKRHITSIGCCIFSGQAQGSLLWAQNLGYDLCWWSIPCPRAHTETALPQLCHCKKTHRPNCCIGNTEQFVDQLIKVKRSLQVSSSLLQSPNLCCIHFHGSCRRWKSGKRVIFESIKHQSQPDFQPSACRICRGPHWQEPCSLWLQLPCPPPSALQLYRLLLLNTKFVEQALSKKEIKIQVAMDELHPMQQFSMVTLYHKWLTLSNKATLRWAGIKRVAYPMNQLSSYQGTKTKHMLDSSTFSDVAAFGLLRWAGNELSWVRCFVVASFKSINCTVALVALSVEERITLVFPFVLFIALNAILLGSKWTCQHTWRPSEGASVGPANHMVIVFHQFINPLDQNQNATPKITFFSCLRWRCGPGLFPTFVAEVVQADAVPKVLSVFSVIFGSCSSISIFYFLSFGNGNSKYFGNGLDKNSIQFLKNCQEEKPFSAQ